MIDSLRARFGAAVLWKVTVTAVVGLLLGGVTGRARGQSAAPDEVLKLQKDFQDKCVAGDVAGINAMMADDAIFIHGNGAMQGKAEFLGSIKNGQLSLSAYELKDPKVILFEGGAIVSGLEDLAFKPPAGSNAPPRVIHMRGSAVWVHKAGAWHLFLDQDTTLAGPPPSGAPASR
ncbi:MAG TPA: nuclear transport factor 2 family protein [Candidatus Acidoferrales bacterium]|nr:nuclear transport factor 2 family protein [Candidatus Acidoferrales bacterium]